MAAKVLELQNVSVRSGEIKVLDDISFTVRRNEQWAIIGQSGSGKTQLANTLAGKNFYSGTIEYHFPIKKNDKSTILIVEQQYRFKNLFNTNDLYYQQRYNSYDSEQTIAVEELFREHFPGRSFYRSEWLDALHVRDLLGEPLIQLSNGENKRVQLAMALLEEPELLILDNPFTGLDIEGRTTLHRIIQSISQKGIQLILVTPYDEIPQSITHVACLSCGTLIFADEKINFRPDFRSGSVRSNLDPELLERLRHETVIHYNIAIKMINVNVKYGSRQILQNINWQVRKGEWWGLSGPNGAGKSTLLSLITADNPQAYANEIYLFDKRRGSGESIWDIKQKIGFISPELHMYFDYSSTCFEVIASGLFDTIGLFRQLSEEQSQSIMLWIKLFQLENIRSKKLSQISLSEQRKTLLARALIKTPSLLILDEPCQGLDDEQTLQFKNLIDQVCRAFETTLVYVSHYQDQIPECVDHFFRLEKGKVVL